MVQRQVSSGLGVVGRDGSQVDSGPTCGVPVARVLAPGDDDLSAVVTRLTDVADLRSFVRSVGAWLLEARGA